MLIHDKYITQIKELLNVGSQQIKIDNSKNWNMLEKSDYLMENETLVELGSTSDSSVSLTVCSTEMSFEDQIFLIGKDISQLSGKVPNFAKIVVVSLEDNNDENTIYRNIREVNRAKFSLNYEGTMLRGSTGDNKECLRISKKSYKKGFNISILGNILLRKLKTFDFVKNVQIYYIVDDYDTVSKLTQYSEKVNTLTSALNHVFDNINLDCSSCVIKDICDEVEGMRDAHKNMYSNKK